MRLRLFPLEGLLWFNFCFRPYFLEKRNSSSYVCACLERDIKTICMKRCISREEWHAVCTHCRSGFSAFFLPLLSKFTTIAAFFYIRRLALIGRVLEIACSQWSFMILWLNGIIINVTTVDLKWWACNQSSELFQSGDFKGWLSSARFEMHTVAWHYINSLGAWCPLQVQHHDMG